MKPKAIWLSIVLATALPAAPAFAQVELEVVTSSAGFEAVIEALRAQNLTAEEIRTTDEIEGLQIVDLKDLGPDQKLTLEETLREAEDGFAEVQTAIEVNELFDIRLEQQSVDRSRIFAATRSEDGIVTIYLR